jgi:hypothetical protein
MSKLRKALSLIDEPESEDTSLDFHSLPPIAKGELQLVCGSCGAVLGECVATRDLYVAAAALLRNRMPVRLILTCTGCGKYNLIPPSLAD